jgi:hypothetical protein
MNQMQDGMGCVSVKMNDEPATTIGVGDSEMGTKYKSEDFLQRWKTRKRRAKTKWKRRSHIRGQWTTSGNKKKYENRRQIMIKEKCDDK